MVPSAEKEGSSIRYVISRPFQLIDKILTWLEKVILTTAILLMAAVSIANVIARNIGESLTFANEIAQVLLVIVTFVGVGYGVRNARHIRVSAIHDLLPLKARKVLLILTSFTSSAFLCYLGFYAIEYTTKLADSGRILPSLQIPLFYFYGIVPIGLFIGAIQFFLAGTRNLISKDNYLSWNHKDEYELPSDAMDADTAQLKEPGGSRD